MCLRSILQKHSPRICQILWRINEIKFWNSSIAIKRRALLQKLVLTQKEVVSYCSVQRANNKEWFPNIKKCVHLMHIFNVPTTTFFIRKLKRENMSDLKITNTWLKEAYKYQRLWRHEEGTKTFIIQILCITNSLCKFL